MLLRRRKRGAHAELSVGGAPERKFEVSQESVAETIRWGAEKLLEAERLRDAASRGSDNETDPVAEATRQLRERRCTQLGSEAVLMGQVMSKLVPPPEDGSWFDEMGALADRMGEMNKVTPLRVVE